MSFLARISYRAARLPSAVPRVMPKGLAARQAVPIARAEDAAEEEQTLSPARPAGLRLAQRQEAEEQEEEVSRQETEEEPEAQRQPEEEGEEEVAPLRRQEGEEEETVATLRRQKEGEEEVAPLRRQEEEEETVATLRRQEEEELEAQRQPEENGEEEVAPLRRKEEEEETVATLRRQEEEEEVQPMRAIARQEEVPLEETGQTSSPRSQIELEPKAEPASPDLPAEQDPVDLQALHRVITPGPGLPPAAPATPGEPVGNHGAAWPSGEPPRSPVLPATSRPESPAPAHFVPAGFAPDPGPPNVVIDQLDVLIHEPAPAPGRHAPRADRGRAFRARYLRRL